MAELLELPGRRAGWCTERWVGLWAGLRTARRAGLRAVQWTGQRAGSYAGLWAVRRAYWRGIRPAAHRTVAYQTQPGDTTFGTECASHGAGLRAPLRAPRQ